MQKEGISPEEKEKIIKEIEEKLAKDEECEEVFKKEAGIGSSERHMVKDRSAGRGTKRRGVGRVRRR
ncbi:hypothetical protein KJ969_01365 [Patescibacteria group bacterium]|nr:hypothetical protein [Patescibacteria group bacterium]MBU1922335.1 hypothetical protein [Patescibacteria group bacterium]